MPDDFDLLLTNTPTVLIQSSNNEIYIKRDDLLPFSFGGNKLRIAIEFIRDMKKQDKDCMVGYGNARSNLSRVLANLCCRYKIPCHIISPADDNGDRIDTYNSRIVTDCKAIFHYCRKEDVKETVEGVLEELKESGLKPYYIYGDSNARGNEHIPLLAYMKTYKEIKNIYDYIFLPTGTGMTQGGLLAGKAVSGGREKIIGISVARKADKEIDVIKHYLDCFSDRISKIIECEINIEDDYLCGGYGLYNKDIEEIINNQFINSGIALDPTYTGKAFWGMLEYIKSQGIRNKKILFIHTGGTPLFFDYMNKFALSKAKP